MSGLPVRVVISDEKLYLVDVAHSYIHDDTWREAVLYRMDTDVGNEMCGFC